MMGWRASGGTLCATACSSAIARTARCAERSAKRARAGSNRADSWGSVPIVRIANIGLEPGAATLDDLLADVKRGIYIEGHGSYSIDQRRYNFQFGGDAFWLIENGKRTHMLRDVIYHGITPEFWNSCDGVADRPHRRRYRLHHMRQGPAGPVRLDDACRIPCAVPPCRGHQRIARS